MSRVLLFGGGLQSLSVSRGLKDYNHEVINIADKGAVGKHSRYIDSFYSIDLEKYGVENFTSFINQSKVDLVIPTEDEYAAWLSDNKECIYLSSTTKLATVDSKLFKSVIDKDILLSLCKEFQVPHPKTERLDIDTLSKMQDNYCYPILIKPNISNGSRGISIVHSYDELILKAPKIVANFGNCTLQEFIENDHYYNVMLYRYSDGSWGPSVATKISRFYPVKGGSSSFCTTIQNESLLSPCKKLLEKVEWTGFADFDVLEKGVGDYRIIEINPRVPASIHAAYVSGVNYGQVILEDLLNSRKISMDYVPGKQLRFLGLDIAWFLASPNRFKSSPTWFKFWGKDLYYQEGGIKDWRAMFFSIFTGIRKQLSPSFRRDKAGMN